MGERKVLNKYIPPDFDPKLVPRSKRPEGDLVPVRMMLPFSIQCSTCSSFMYRGRKFNSKKEPMRGPEGKYLTIQRFRFYIKCTVCSRPISFLTDPKNSDYEMESGATRNYEIWHDKEKTEEEVEKEREIGEKSDPMRALENRVLDSQREMADLDNLDEIKAMNMKHLQMMSASTKAGDSEEGFDSTVKAVMMAREKNEPVAKEEELNENGLTADEEEMVRKIKFGNRSNLVTSGIRRLGEDDEKIIDNKRRAYEEEVEKQQSSIMENKMIKKDNTHKSKIIPVVKVKRKRKVVANEEIERNDVLAPEIKKTRGNSDKTNKPCSESDDSDTGVGLGGLLGAYDSDSD